MLAGINLIAQDPTPIPNWTPTQPASENGQYSPAQQPGDPNQQYDYAPQQPQQYGQPQYQQPPAYIQQPDINQQQAYDAPDQAPTPPYQPQQAISPDRLEQMVAPIALYPDNLVSMILAASTYPAQVVAANQWLHAMGAVPPEQIAAAANSQTSWDPSVKALTAFPQVLDQMAQSLQWTTDLGNAYYNQPQDVMQTIQVMRARAQAAGNLQDNQQQVVVQDQGNIQIAPPTPQIVYVPQYDPWAVYGAPVAPYAGFNWIGATGSFFGNAFISWGPGIAMNAFAFTPFGWLGWGLDWFSHAIFFGNNVWCTHSWQVHDWGFAHGGARYWGAHGQLSRWGEHGGSGNRGGWNHTLRSGLDRGRFGGGGNPAVRAFNGGGERGNYGNRAGTNYGHGFAGNSGNTGRSGSNGYSGQNGSASAHSGGGQSYGRNGSSYGGNGYGMPRGGSYANGGAESRMQNGRGLNYAYNGANGAYGQQGRSASQGYQAYNHGPQPTGGPQQSRGAGFAEGRSGSYGYPTARTFGNSYGGGYAASSSPYSRPLQNYGMRPGFSGSYTQPYRTPSYSYDGSRTYGSGNVYGNHAYTYGGSSIARAPSGGGFQPFAGRRSNGGYSYGGGSYKAPRAPSFSSHSFGGGGFKAPSAPHFSGGGGHFSGGSHFSGGGHFSSGHSGGGGHGGGGHHR